MPDEVVFGRILPACGLMLFTSTLYYAWLAYKLAKETGRDDVTALPSGTSVPHMFVVVFVIMLPIALKTGDPVKGWEAGLTWVFIQSFVLMVGGFVAPYIRKITQRAALLGTLAGVSIAFISLRPALEMFMTPIIGVVCFAIILASWFGGVRYFKGIPAGLIAIATGMLIAWVWRDEPRKARRVTLELRFLLPGPGNRPHVLGVRVPGGHPGHRHPLRDLRPRRGDGQRRERLDGRGPIPDHARPDGRRGHQPHGLSHGQPLHPRGLHRASRMEGDRRAHRLFRGDRCDGDPLVLVRGRRAHDTARPRRGDLADPALHR